MFGRGRGNAGPPPWQDAETVIDLTLVEEAAFGITRKSSISNMPIECESAAGGERPKERTPRRLRQLRAVVARCTRPAGRSSVSS